MLILAGDEAVQHPGNDGLDLVALSRLVRKRGKPERAEELYERALRADLPAEIGRVARRELAMLVKRSGNFVRANALWEELAEGLAHGPSEAFHAFEQLAIFCEHREKDLKRAADICLRALKLLRHAKTSRWHAIDPAKAARTAASFEHRLKRIETLALRLSPTKQSLLSKAMISESRRDNPESNPA